MNFFQRVVYSLIFILIIAFFGLSSFVLLKSQSPEYYLESKLLNDSKSVSCVLFSPDNDVQTILINLINCEKKKILAAVYTFTQRNVAQALIDAYQRGVLVECVVDGSYKFDKFSKVEFLVENKIPVWVYRNDKALMHNKFCIFEQNFLDKSILWTGSYNFTNKANKMNQENVIILDNSELVKKFLYHFDILKKRSILINNKTNRRVKTEEESSIVEKIVKVILNWFDIKV